MIDQTEHDHIKSILLPLELYFTTLYWWHTVDNKVGQQGLSSTQCQPIFKKVLGKMTC